jgi:hypothetical protein
MFVSVTRGIFVLCHHIIVNLFVRKPELNGANLPNFDLNSCHFCPSFFCPPTVHTLFFSIQSNPKNLPAQYIQIGYNFVNVKVPCVSHFTIYCFS